MLASSEPPHSPTATPMVSSSAMTGATIAFRAPGSTASSRSSSSARTRSGVPRSHVSQTSGAGPSDVSSRVTVSPSSTTPCHRSPRRTSTAARANPSRLHEWCTSASMTSSKRCARSSSVPSCTSVSSCARLCRSARSLTDEKIAAANANSRKVAALTSATRSVTAASKFTRSASAAACARSSSSAHQIASLSPVRYDTSTVTAMTSRNTRNRSGLA